MGRGLRARLARKRRFNRRLKGSLRATQVAAAEMEERNRRSREENALLFVVNTLTDQLIYYCLVEVENDPLMRNALERINDQNPGDGAAADDRRE